MKIKSIDIENFRAIKKATVCLEDELSLLIGKNNSGKTSIIRVLEKFLGHSQNNRRTFEFDDFNISFSTELQNAIRNELPFSALSVSGISLALTIEYAETDNLANIAPLLVDLDPLQNSVVLRFTYSLDSETYQALLADARKFQELQMNKDIKYFLDRFSGKHFKTRIESIDRQDEKNNVAVEPKSVRKLINLQIVEATRDVSNSGDSQTLSKLSSEYYDMIVGGKDDSVDYIDEFRKQILQTDEEINRHMKSTFKPVMDSISRFSRDSTQLEIISQLQERDFLNENSKVRYAHENHSLPETHTGLGYMNLFSIIFSIHIRIDRFKKLYDSEGQTPADLNLLLIEEPEAHTHPQMQYIFIRNIKRMLGEEAKGKFALQTIMTTHSSHIVSECEFDDIKYCIRRPDATIEIRNLASLHTKYSQQENGQVRFAFLKKYLTLVNAELFFADKAIFIEGATERILLPAMMRKCDAENTSPEYVPLLSQNISIVEVGNYVHVFDAFLDFLDIKSLVITDIDSVDADNSACPVVNGSNSSNPTIAHYFPSGTFDSLKQLTFEDKVIQRDGGNNLAVTFQTPENSCHARSFEEAFLSINLPFVQAKKEAFTGLKNRGKLLGDDFYHLADTCINKKTDFATDILFNSADDLSLWNTPEYIRKGLEWLGEN